MEFPAIEYFRLQSFCRQLSLFIHACRENFHTFASKFSPTSSPNCTDQYQYWLNPLPLLFKSLLHGQIDRVFSAGI
jgi:hypothetical protein